MFQFTRQLTWRDLRHERLKLENCIISPQEGVMDYSCCAILCSIFVRDNPSPHSSKRLVKEKTPWKKQYTIVRKHDTIKGWNKWWSDNTTSTSTRKRIIVLAYQVDCSFFLSFRFPSNIHSQGIISLNRDDPLVYPQQLPIPGYGFFGTIWTWNSFDVMRCQWKNLLFCSILLR